MSIDVGQIIPSFLNLYAQEKNFQHISLGRSGATNLLIRLQIEEAIKQNADFIVVGSTSNDRIDLAITETCLPITLHDVYYDNYSSDSEKYIINQNPSVISDSISNWIGDHYDLNIHQNRDRSISSQIIEAMKYYVTYLHDNAISTTKDYYIIAEGLRKLISLNKKFVFIPSIAMAECDWTFIGTRLWPGKLLWEMPYGFEPTTITHNPRVAHEYFAKILLDMTADWK